MCAGKSTRSGASEIGIGILDAPPALSVGVTALKVTVNMNVSEDHGF